MTSMPATTANGPSHHGHLRLRRSSIWQVSATSHLSLMICFRRTELNQLKQLAECLDLVGDVVLGSGGLAIGVVPARGDAVIGATLDI